MIIQSERVWIAGQFLPAQILIENGKIAAVLKRGSRNADRDYGSHAVLPGFIDVHTHGAYGPDTGGGSDFHSSHYCDPDAGCADQGCGQCGAGNPGGI